MVLAVVLEDPFLIAVKVAFPVSPAAVSMSKLYGGY
jgi:hypothetical protein